jgi:aminoglycoside phosphotransferase family enzyme
LVECHGDLRPEHVCLVDPPVVIDCLEFDPALRQLDPFEELAFLGLECTVLAARWVGPRLTARCARALGDAPPAALLDLYVACRAVLRARLSLAHLLEPDPRTPEKWLPLGRRYLDLARAALDHLAEGPRSS